jgi:DNA-directed RNA polymerase subunit beta'
MLAPYNFLSPATGEPIIMPSQDMVLGCYYLTAENPTQQNKQAYYFSNLEDALLAYDSNKIPLHSYIWVRFNGVVDNENSLINVEKQSDGTELHIFDDRIIRKNKNGETVVQYLLTTPGRILLNKVLLDSLVITK